MDEAERLAREFVANFNEVDIDDVDEFSADIQLYRAGQSAERERLAKMAPEFDYGAAYQEAKHGESTNLEDPADSFVDGARYQHAQLAPVIGCWKNAYDRLNEEHMEYRKRDCIDPKIYNNLREENERLKASVETVNAGYAPAIAAQSDLAVEREKSKALFDALSWSVTKLRHLGIPFEKGDLALDAYSTGGEK